MHETTTEPTADPAWPAPFLDALAADDRIIGAAELDEHPNAGRSLWIVTSWDGRDPVAADLARLGTLALGAEPAVARSDGNHWQGLSADGRRVELDVVRIGDLKPSARGERATVVRDTKQLLEQWTRWSAGRDRTREQAAAPDRAQRLLWTDALLRTFTEIPAGSASVRSAGAPRQLRSSTASVLRQRRSELPADDPVADALRARIDTALASMPGEGTGLRVVPDTSDPAASLEAFLRVADAEGFLGDRVLFDAAVKRLTELARRTPVFDEGFVLPTFDAVEARWRVGDGVGGCKTPLIPGVYVGVGVTPKDHLEFWAAPFVREPLCTVACVADDGTRVVLERTAGKDAFFGALLGEVDRAWDGLPDLLRAARRAGRTPAGDVERALSPLHLPKSYRLAAREGVGRRLTPSRLQVALALARAGDDQDPLNARKFGLAAGRLLAETPPGAPEGCDTSA